MLERYDWKKISVKNIRLPVGNLADISVPSKEYLINRYRLGEDDREVISPEAALLLTKTHPIFTWSKNNYCVYGLRTLYIVSSIIPNTTIEVGVLPPNTPESEIEKLILADDWLAKLVYSTKTPETDIFKSWRKIPKELLLELSPALDMKIVEIAKVLKVSVPTLYKSIED